MSEDNRRSRTFGEAKARSRIGKTESAIALKEWTKKYQDQLADAQKAAQEESDAKGFWGKAFTIGTTLGCVALDAASGGMCTIGGLIVGSAARAIADAVGDAEAMVPDAVDALDTKYFRADAADMAGDINKSIDSMRSFHDNEWKTDVLKQAADTYSAYKMGTSLESWQGEGSTLFDKLKMEIAPTVEEVQLTESAQLMAEDPLKAMGITKDIQHVETPALPAEMMDMSDVAPTDLIRSEIDFNAYQQVPVPEEIPLGINETNILTRPQIESVRGALNRMQPDVPFNIQEDTSFYDPAEAMIESPGLSSFDEASWTEGAARIEALDRSAALQENLEMGLQINKKLPLSFQAAQQKFKLGK